MSDATHLRATAGRRAARRTGSRLGFASERLFLAVAAAWLGRLPSGRVRLELPAGTSRWIGPVGREPSAEIALKSYDLFWRSLKRGSLGFAECYVDGAWTTPDLADVFRYFLANQQALRVRKFGGFRTTLADRLYHATRANTREGSQRNIAEHYDLGNAFYKLWLDDSMTYSSAIFAHPGETLEAAQERKYARILDLLDMRGGERLLEIGIGWGGLAERAARRGAHVTGLTLSREQLAYAKARLAEAGLSAAADLHYQDYRDAAGTFDRIVSVEMIEAVGADNWPAYFSTLRDRLRPGGRAVLQAITIGEAHYDSYRRKPDFIQRYVFPGGMLPTPSIIRAQADRAGLVVRSVETFGESYVQTLWHWLERFRARWPEIAALGFDERFQRLWTYYLIYCAVGFEAKRIDVGLYTLERPA